MSLKVLEFFVKKKKQYQPCCTKKWGQKVECRRNKWIKETEREQSHRQGSIESLYLSLPEETLFSLILFTRLTFHNVTPPLVSPWNDVWEKQVQKLYTDDVTIQILVVLLIGCATRRICFSQSEALPKGSPVWIFCTAFSRGNQWWHRESGLFS